MVNSMYCSQWRTGSEFLTGHGTLNEALLFTNTEGFKYIVTKEALFNQKGGPFQDFEGGPPATGRWANPPLTMETNN